jgi:hypothetical protein
MAWRVCNAILVFRAEVNDRWPDRSTKSDGTIGNTAHKRKGLRGSDHNPWVIDRNGIGVVTAIDITHDPKRGPDCNDLAETLRRMGAAGDERVKYVIWNRRIVSPIRDWAWRPYAGPNPHAHHLHLSVSGNANFYDSPARWLPELAPTDEGPDMFIGTYSDGRIFLVGLEGKRLLTRATADEIKAFGVPERKVSSALLNLFPTLPAPVLK